MQKYFHDIDNSGRCRMYKEIKQSYKMESYLKCNIRRTLQIYFARFRLYSYRFLIERRRWIKPKIELPNRIFTLFLKIKTFKMNIIWCQNVFIFIL